MDLVDAQLQSVNVVVVYPAIDLPSISRDRARNIGTGQPMLTDIPGEFILVVYQDLRIHCQYDQRRLTIQAQEPSEEFIDSDVLPEMVLRAISAISQPQAVRAFGANYSILAGLQGESNIDAVLRNRFLARAKEISATLQGEIEGIGVSLKYACPSLASVNMLQLRQEYPRNLMRALLNVHREPGEVPEAHSLREFLVGGYCHLQNVLAGL